MKKYYYNLFSICFVLVVFLILLYLYIKYIYFNRCGMPGKYIKISGDTNQPKYIDNIKIGRSTSYIYYDDKHNKIDEGTATPSLFKRECLTTHNKSSSICKKIYLTDDTSVSECIGFATEKFNKKNINYKSFHKYYRVNNTVYYENIYFYEDGDISFAIYKKM